MQIRSIAIFEVLLRPQYYYHYYGYGVQCGWESDQ